MDGGRHCCVVSAVTVACRSFFVRCSLASVMNVEVLDTLGYIDRASTP